VRWHYGVTNADTLRLCLSMAAASTLLRDDSLDRISCYTRLIFLSALTCFRQRVQEYSRSQQRRQTNSRSKVQTKTQVSTITQESTASKYSLRPHGTTIRLGQPYSPSPLSLSHCRHLQGSCYLGLELSLVAWMGDREIIWVPKKPQGSLNG
jgi:hypothetical protein